MFASEKYSLALFKELKYRIVCSYQNARGYKMSDLYSIILAAGEGKRMKSNIAKPLQIAVGKPLAEWVVDTATEAGSVENIMVVGHKAEDVKEYFGDRVTYRYQYERLGTGHAVMQGIDAISSKEGTVVVLYGDAPLIEADVLKAAYAQHMSENAAATVITAVVDEPFGYGRIVRENGSIAKIVEQKDASDEQKLIKEVNSGMYFFDIQKLLGALKRVTNDNAQGEYYITDVIEILLGDGEKVGVYITGEDQILGVNDRLQLAQVSKILYMRKIKQVMLDGVTVIDPDATYIGADVKIGRDTVIYPNTSLDGKTEIGENCAIGPDTNLTNCTIGNNTEVIKTVGIESAVGEKTHVGPFAYLRPGSRIGGDVKIGDFVEIKNSSVGDGTKVSHLTYIGDADVGKRVNFGCGTVVVNYDGHSKHRSVIEDDCFIGCNTNLVSPVLVRKGAYTAAGSTITKEVPENSLAIARSREVIKQDWVAKKEKEQK